jgi:hypothetical protein
VLFSFYLPLLCMRRLKYSSCATPLRGMPQQRTLVCRSPFVQGTSLWYLHIEFEFNAVICGAILQIGHASGLLIIVYSSATRGRY